MKRAFGILKRDLLALVKNPIALLVVGALLVLPGLYAWYCIVANWDPYAHTGNMPIAVVNHDKGAEGNLTGKVNIGEQVTEKLQDNDSIDWRFYDDEDEALFDTRLGSVYATLVLPEDLSENLLGIFEGSTEKPTIYYYPNEKYNAVATKVTDSAAQTLIQQINQGFSSTVNEKILTSTQDIVDRVEERADATNKSAIAQIREIQADLEKVIVSLDDATGSIAGWRDAAAGASSALSAAAERLPTIREALARGSDELNTLSGNTGNFESELAGVVLNATSTISNLSAKASATLAQATTDMKTVQTDASALAQAIGSDLGLADLKAESETLEALAELIGIIVGDVNTRIAEIDATVQEITSAAAGITNRISNEVMPQLNSGTFSLATSLSGLSGAIGQFEPQVAGLLNVLAQTDSALQTATTSIADAKTMLATIGANLKGTVSDIGAIGSALEIERVTALLNADPDNVGTFISMPVEMVTEKIFPVSNYGTAVAPFYTNLALWIGCFILVSLMRVEVTGAGIGGTTRRERYFGRWLLFVILSLLQSQVICGVDILLGIDCAHPGLFMLSGAVCSFAYMNLIYALVRTFRNMGRTLCIFLLIMQVPGSSGMYPIEMMPGFFQFIHPMLPFTYGIDAMRESLLGLNGLAIVKDLVLLLLIVPLSLLIGLGLRSFMANLLLMFDAEMNKVGFFASEETTADADMGRVRSLVRTLATHDSYSDEIEERAWKFNRTYPRLRKVGTIATFAIPFAFLVLMLPFNLTFSLSTDTKLTVIIVMLILLGIVLLGITVLEYMNRVITDETRLLGASIIGDDWEVALPGANAAATDDAGVTDDADADATAAANADANTSGTPAGVIPATQGLAARKPHRGPTTDIFVTDMKLGFQSSVGTVVIMLLVITPAMYAWFNIAGSWDPYSSTGNLKVAVANEDDGYRGDLLPITINVGDTLVSQLRGNENFDWVFVDKDEAIEGVESSRYYAAIEIPDDFTANLMTYIIEDADYPQVTYYTNEKENPIAPIITQKGADAIQENIRVSFTERIDAVALSIAYDVLGYVKSPQMSDYVTKMSRHLDDATGDTVSASRQIRSLASLCTTIAGIVDTTGATLEGIRSAGASAKSAIEDAKAGAANAGAALDQALAVVRELLNGPQLDISRIQTIIDAALELLEAGAAGIPDRINSALANVEGKAPDASASESVKAKYNVLVTALTAAKQHADAVPGDVGGARAKLDALVQSARNEAASARDYFEGSIVPSIESLKSTISTLSSSTSEVVSGLEGAVSGLDDSTGGLTNQLNSLSSGLAKAGERLESAATGIDATKKRMAEALRSGDLKQIEDVIMGGDPELLAQSLAAPIGQERLPVYSVSNYGSAMAPFYTVLSLWVGALVMISTMRVHVVEERIEELRRRYGRVRPRHEFFGRYGIFGFVGLLQSSLVLLGDLLLLHIQCENPVMFFVFGVFIGQAFCLIVYTITELFGDVGKALCVILLIMQVAASGGTFPVEMLHPVLLNIVSYLPFYYAMSLLQECVAGIFWLAAVFDVVALAVMAGCMLVIGLPLRRPFRKLNDFFEAQLEKTGYM